MANVNTVLSERIEALEAERRWPIVGLSLAAHLALLGLAIVAPMLAAGKADYPEFVSVRIVPIQALGVPEPRQVQAAESRPRQEKAPDPEPEPEPEKPRPAEEEPPPKPSTQPAMASPTASRKPRPEPPAPAAGDQAPAQRAGSPTGSSFGSAAFGASVGFDNPDFTYGYYVDQMLAMIRQQWVRPPIGGEIEVMVRFRIQADGRVTEIGIARSSGFNQFDLAGLRAIQAAAPLPPLPRSYGHDSLGVNLIMR